MRLIAQKFLLFSFAFSSVFTLEIPGATGNGKITTHSSVSKSTGTQVQVKGGVLKTEGADHGLDKRSAEVYPENFNEEEEMKQGFYEDKSPEKRTRVGFTGMRGKKEFTADDYCGKAPRGRLEGALNKRVFRTFNELLGGKRASYAFHGMRGKKSQDYEGEGLDPETLNPFPRREFLIDAGLMDDPGEVPEFQEESGDEGALSKRSPYAFQGMRGKKESADDLKRAMGFLGMRGKKAAEVWDSGNDSKRAPQASFFGMKGKKAQSSGFFGMRGKKASANAFFGIKGKRDPLGPLFLVY